MARGNRLGVPCWVRCLLCVTAGGSVFSLVATSWLGGEVDGATATVVAFYALNTTAFAFGRPGIHVWPQKSESPPGAISLAGCSTDEVPTRGDAVSVFGRRFGVAVSRVGLGLLGRSAASKRSCARCGCGVALSVRNGMLTAIELDPEPQPPHKLRFKNVRGSVLHHVRESTAQDGMALGSLGAHLGTRFDGRFDVVVSNPPWTSVDKALGAQFGNVCRRVIRQLNRAQGEKYLLPDNNPDLPFLWRATEWCRKGGRIAMALPARILLKTAPVPSAARSVLFELLQVDGIVNGTNLSDTPVWPDMSQPWILLFATNTRPERTHRTCFVTLPVDSSLNRAGRFRIDSESTRLIDSAEAVAKPWLWKALSVGTMLDVEVIETLSAAGASALNEYWRTTVGKNRNGKGYTRGRPEERTRSAEHLKDLPHLTATQASGFVVDPAELPIFELEKVQWPMRGVCRTR